MKSMTRVIRGNLWLILVVVLTACGGGGGGGGTSGISYTGITSQASVSHTNAVSISTNAYQGGSGGDTVGGARSQSSGVNQTGQPRHLMLTQIVENTVRKIDFSAKKQNVNSLSMVTTTVVVPGDCPVNPGSASITLTVDNQTGNFSGTINFSSYCSDGNTVTGGVNLSGKIDLITSDFIPLNFSFSALTVLTSCGDSFTANGSIVLNTNSTAKTKTMTINMFLKDNSTSKVFWVKDYNVTTVDYTSYVDASITSGQFYHPDYGYVTMASTTPIRRYTGDQWPSQGVIVLTGNAGTGAKLTIIDNTQYQIEADSNGDGLYEYNSGVLSWSNICVANSGAKTLSWPVNQTQTITISQDYSVYNDPEINNSKYHTGIDLYTSDLAVKAADTGTVYFKYTGCDTSSGTSCGGCWGNHVIIQHPTAIYSVYAHLASPVDSSVIVGSSISKGDPVGIMGKTGNVKGTHLHFEVLNIAPSIGQWSSSSKCYDPYNHYLGAGYLADLPDGYDFMDPRVYIYPFTETAITPVVVKVISTINPNVRSGPGTSTDPVQRYAQLTQLQPNQKFVAYKQNGDWYKVYQPNANGSISGWVAKIYGGETYLLEDTTVGQVQVKNTGGIGLNVRTYAGATGATCDSTKVKTVNDLECLKIWDGQRFAVLDKSTVGGITWYKIDLPTLASQSFGWVSGDWVDYFPGI